MLIDRNFLNKKLPNSHNNTKYKEKNWLSNEIQEVNDLATWTTSNTKPIERKFYQQELEEHLNQNENIKDDHKHDNKKK